MSHRGRGRNAHENTIQAFLSAVDAGFEWVEFDVRRTMDGVIVVHHDPDMDGISLNVMTFKELNIRANRKGFTVPTLEEVLFALAGKIKIDVEFKEYDFGMEALLMILKHFNREDFMISSFDYDFIHEMSRKGQQIQLGLIISWQDLKGNPFNFLKNNLMIDRLVLSGANIIVVERSLLFWNFINRVKARGFKVIVWTVNNRDEFYKMSRDPRIEAVCSDLVLW
jgi:glycerophosphoryl diester phosphodiesterase